MTESSPQSEFVGFIEGLLDEHGPNSQSAVGWFRGDAEARYRVMLGLIRPHVDPVSLLDFGCGLAGLLDYVRETGTANLEYTGLDLSEKLLAIARERHSGTPFIRADVLGDGNPSIPEFDYVVMNGIFTYRGTRSNDQMFTYLKSLVTRVWRSARVGLALNVITPQVDWQRDDLFHLPLDDLLTFLSQEISRHVVIRHDYGLYEYTAYVYRDPTDPSQLHAKRLVTPRT